MRGLEIAIDGVHAGQSPPRAWQNAAGSNKNPRGNRSYRGVFIMVEIRNSGRALSNDDIVKLEQRIRCRLPESYRRFLLKNNGGRPPLNIDAIDIEHLPGAEVDVGDFFGIDDQIEACDIDWNLTTFKGRIASELLPIACDSFGNLFCVSLSDSDYGSIVYCDFDPNWHLGGATYYRVAPDFDSFLERIRPREAN
jgi:hypothetical protein